MYNELEYLPKAINISKDVLNRITDDYEIIIVDDASNDGSEIIAANMAKEDNKIRVFRHQINRKLGGSLKTGFYNASKDIIIYTDMDMPFDFNLLPHIIPEISNYDILVGVRRGHRESFRRSVYSFIYNHLINILFCLQLRDVNFVKIFRREILDNIELKSEGSFINVEFLAKAKRLGYSIKEIELDYRPRLYGRSRLSSLSVIFKILYEMAKFYFEIKTFRILRLFI
jgi:glycosyltransferase involved in cell wall biosynthesis